MNQSVVAFLFSSEKVKIKPHFCCFPFQNKDFIKGRWIILKFGSILLISSKDLKFT